MGLLTDQSLKTPNFFHVSNSSCYSCKLLLLLQTNTLSWLFRRLIKRNTLPFNFSKRHFAAGKMPGKGNAFVHGRHENHSPTVNYQKLFRYKTMQL